MKKGDVRFDRLAFGEALPFYLKFADNYPASLSIKEKLGDCYRHMNNPMKAEMWYGDAVDEGAAIQYRHHYATALMQNGKFDEAATEFSKYLDSQPSDELSKIRMESCENPIPFLQDSNRYDINLLDINTETADFGPSLMDSNLVFASNRAKSSWVFAWLDNAFLDLYQSEIQSGLSMKEPVKMKGIVNSKYHEAMVSFTETGDTMYFTRNNFHKGKVRKDDDGTMHLKTYYAMKKGKRWKKIKAMNFNSDDYSAGHPTVFDGGTKMIIASDMPGTMGGTDLFLVEMVNGEWGTPVNLGEEINSVGNELFPWVSPDGTLIYSSNGRHGLGGLDLYHAKRDGDQWVSSTNMGYPINTSMDDFSLVITENGRTGFFSSNRGTGKGDDDIYGFNFKKLVVVKVVDAETGLPIPGASVALSLDDLIETNSLSGEDGEARAYPSGDGTYDVKVGKSGYKEGIGTVDLNTDDPLSAVEVTISLEPAKDENCDPINYLDGKIFADRDNPMEGAEVLVREKVTSLKLDNDMSFLENLDHGKVYEVEVKSDFMPPRKVTIDTRKSGPNDTIPLEISFSPRPSDIGEVFYIIYYNYDKHDIRSDASLELDRVVKFMKHFPDVSVELGSHTDSRGSNDYNENLSKNRAIEAFDYITKNGIDKSRLSYKWFGEKELTNGCKDGVECGEDAHQLNRRTEFILRGIGN